MSEFAEYLKEVFAEFGLIQARKMFGGYGMYHQVADDTLYLKVDTKIQPLFEAKGLGPFEYAKGDTVVKMSYSVAPDAILDDPYEAALWAQRSYNVALQAKSSPRKSSKRKFPKGKSDSATR